MVSYEDSLTVKKIFPNDLDTVNFFESRIKHSIPTPNALQKYNLYTFSRRRIFLSR